VCTVWQYHEKVALTGIYASFSSRFATLLQFITCDAWLGFAVSLVPSVYSLDLYWGCWKIHLIPIVEHLVHISHVANSNACVVFVSDMNDSNLLASACFKRLIVLRFMVD
jgi:hypothetical protein